MIANNWRLTANYRPCPTQMIANHWRLPDNYRRRH
jgi:hypothetical protein